MQVFTLKDDEAATLILATVDGEQAPAPATAITAASDNVAVLAVNPNLEAGQFTVTSGGAPGVANFALAGVDETGAPFNGTLQFNVTGTPAVGFVATLINVRKK